MRGPTSKDIFFGSHGAERIPQRSLKILQTKTSKAISVFMATLEMENNITFEWENLLPFNMNTFLQYQISLSFCHS